tara:strand:+ start:445 stop:945 length:501 start_codon:yes stop_codon:yes gene_type:complete
MKGNKMKPKTNTMQREKQALQQQLRDLNKKINKETWEYFERHFKFSSDTAFLHPKPQLGTLDGKQKDGVITLIFKISTYNTERKESLKHLHAFVDMFNKQKNKIDGFVMDVVTTDFSILGEVIEIQLVHKFSSDYVVSGFTYGMTFNDDGISDTDLPHIYTENVWS